MGGCSGMVVGPAGAAGGAVGAAAALNRNKIKSCYCSTVAAVAVTINRNSIILKHSNYDFITTLEKIGFVQYLFTEIKLKILR